MTDRIPFPDHAWPLLRKALEHIAAHPDEFYMACWYVDVDWFEDDERTWWVKELTGRTGLALPACGTVACLAGRISLEAGFPPATLNDDANVNDFAALRALGIEPESPAGVALRWVFLEMHLRDYAELSAALEARFTFPEPLPEPAAVPR